jgi:TRAP-type C4-dicarboxylate transport system substrate-binding protein
MKKTSFLFLTLSLCLLLVLIVGCASPATSTAPAPTTSAAPKTTTAAPATSAPVTSAPASTTPAAAQPAGQKITLTLAGTMPESDIKTLALRQFAAEVLKNTNGQVTINIFPNNQLIADKDMFTAVPAGLADLAQANLASFSGLVPETALITMCMTYSNFDHWWAVIHGPLGDIIAKKMPTNANTKFLAWLSQGPTDVFATTKSTIKVPDDFKGLKFRTPSRALFVKAVNSLGGNGVIISAGELYTALQSGVVTGTFCDSKAYNLNKWFEVAPYVSRMVITPDASHAIIANLNSWNKLPPNVQDVIQKAALNASEWSKANSAQMNADGWTAIQALKDSGKIKDYYVIPPADIAKFKAIVEPSQKEDALKDPKMTPGVMDMIEAARPK